MVRVKLKRSKAVVEKFKVMFRKPVVTGCMIPDRGVNRQVVHGAVTKRSVYSILPS